MRCSVSGCGNEADLARIEVSGRRVVREDAFCQQHGRISLEHSFAQEHVGSGSTTRLEGAVCFDVELVVLRFKDDCSDIFVREVGGVRLFQWRIGYYESLCICGALKIAPHPRPMTHEVPARILAALGGVLEYIVVDRYDEAINAHHAQLMVQHRSGSVQVDVRPSDALAIAIYTGVPFFILETLLP
jgi:bifunctional DNase/RNase